MNAKNLAAHRTLAFRRKMSHAVGGAMNFQEAWNDVVRDEYEELGTPEFISWNGMVRGYFWRRHRIYSRRVIPAKHLMFKYDGYGLQADIAVELLKPIRDCQWVAVYEFGTEMGCFYAPLTAYTTTEPRDEGDGPQHFAKTRNMLRLPLDQMSEPVNPYHELHRVLRLIGAWHYDKEMEK